MTCYHPVRLSSDKYSKLVVSCGQCRGCRLERSRQWAVRCVHEASCHERNCFITLTYNDEHLPADKGLHYSDFQSFMRRLRKFADGRVRFFMCGEYGERNGRPHFHACLFGFDFTDRVFFKTTESGSKLYVSKSLAALWPAGFSSVADVSFESAAYVARYVMKKYTGSGSLLHYTDAATGEIRCSEFCHMSLKPGIGDSWFWQFGNEIREGLMVFNGRKVPAPRYYTKMLDKMGLFEDAKDSRFDFQLSHVGDATPSRLAVRELVENARTRRLKRSL